jgi:phage terminase small subunit
MFTGPQHTLTLRSNLRFPQAVPIEADTRWKRVVPMLQAAGWEDEPHSIAEQHCLTASQLLTTSVSERERRFLSKTKFKVKLYYKLQPV